MLLAYFREMDKLARIAQNQENKAELGWGAKNRKEIELSVQKTKKWYFANGKFGFENRPSFAFMNMEVGTQTGCFDPSGRVYICADTLNIENLRP